MKHLVLLLAVLFSLSLTPVLAADEEQNRPIEEVMANTSHQFIYAFFGRDILIYYLNDGDESEAVAKASESDLIALSRPFNTAIGKVFMIGLTGIYFLSLGYLIVRLVLMLMETGWILQRDGQSTMNPKEGRALALKVILIGGIVATPIPLKNEMLSDTFYTNVATVALFDLMGRAHERGDDAVKEVIASQRQTLKTVALPAYESKKDDMEAINLFYTCVRLSAERENSESYTRNVKIYRTKKGEAEGVISEGNCSLSISLGLDVSSDEKAERIAVAAPELGFRADMFIDSQRDLYQVILPELMSHAEKYSGELAKRNASMFVDDGEFSFEGMTANVKSVSELKAWPARCEELETWTTPDPGYISIKDSVYYHHLTSRCQSKRVADALVYPDAYGAMSSVLGNNTRVNKSLALCVDQATMAQALSDSRFVAEYIGKGKVSSDKIESIALESCLANMCSNQSLVNGGMYACANSLELYENRMRDIRIQERGTMMLGFYMFDLFLHHPPSASAKNVFNHFSMSFSPGATPAAKARSEDDLFFEFGVNIPEAYDHTLRQSTTINHLREPFSRYRLPAYEAPLPETNIIAELTGQERLYSCVRNPMQISNGYVCGNVPQEFSQFGMTLLKNVVTLKTLLITGQTFGQMRKGSLAGGGSVSGDSSGLGASKIEDAMIMALAKQGASLVGADDAFMNNMFDNILGFKYNVTDEFGYLNSRRVDGWMDSALMGAVSALSFAGAESSALLSFVDSVLFVAILTAIVFAFILPMFPMIMFIGALIKFVYLLISTVSMHGFKLAEAATERDGDFLSDGLDKVWADWLALILKLPLTIIGVVLAWLMSNIIISHVMTNMTLVVPTNDGIQGMFDLGIIIIVSLGVTFIVYNMILTLIESFYDFTVEWVLGMMHSNPFSSKQEGMGIQTSKDVLRLLGR